MKAQLLKTIIIVSILLLSPLVHADQNQDVEQWVKDTTVNTFSVDYTQHQSDFDEIRSHYTMNAWSAITGFLSGYLDTIQNNKITVHPIFNDEPKVVNTGYYSGIHYWRVNQILTLPQLRVIIAFSIIVIEKSPNQSQPYLIQSMDINTQKY